MSESIFEELERLRAQLHDDNLTEGEQLEVAKRMLDLISQLPDGEEVVRQLARQALEQIRKEAH